LNFFLKFLKKAKVLNISNVDEELELDIPFEELIKSTPDQIYIENITTKHFLNSIGINRSINNFNAGVNNSRLTISETVKETKVAFNLGSNIVASNKLIDIVLLLVSILYYF
jgi:hypothetical protein